ncbi:hypothetical protein GF312_19560 [Candidatus Poribacteria bacterium]|nr:hypothetical protein [Candidatus Poribacteria bacterium]
MSDLPNNKTRKNNSRKRRDTPEGLWVKCTECSEIIYNGELIRNIRICHKCGYYFPLEPQERLDLLADDNSLKILNTEGKDFNLEKGVENWAIMTADAKLSGHRLIISILNLNFTNHDISLFLCKNLIDAINKAVIEELPLLIVYNNGAALQSKNNVLFPSQSLSINAALSHLLEKDLLYISLLAHSDSHDCFPGFAYLADIVVLESKVGDNIRSTNRFNQKNYILRPDHPLVENGMVDILISREESKKQITKILDFFC